MPRASSPLKKDSRITDALGWRQPDTEVPSSSHLQNLHPFQH